MEKNKIKYIIIALAFFLVLGFVEIILFSQSKNLSKGDSENHYSVSSEKGQASYDTTYTNEKLKAVHCVDSICIENVTLYYQGTNGKMEYTIENRGSEAVSGFVQLVFGDKSLIVSYQDLKAKQKIQGSSYFTEIKIQNTEDYVLKKLTDEEKSEIVYINK